MWRVEATDGRYVEMLDVRALMAARSGVGTEVLTSDQSAHVGRVFMGWRRLAALPAHPAALHVAHSVRRWSGDVVGPHSE